MNTHLSTPTSRALVAAVGLATLMAFAGPAAARFPIPKKISLPGGSSQHTERIEVIERYLAKVPIDESLRTNPPVSKLADVRSAASDGDNRLMFARKEFDKFPTSALTDPGVAAVKVKLERAEDYVRDLHAVAAKLKEQAAEEESARQAAQAAEAKAEREEAARKEAAEQADKDAINTQLQAFSSDYGQHRELLERMKPFWELPELERGYGSTTIADAKQAFAEIDAGCKGKHKAIADPANAWNSGSRWWCEISAVGDEVLQRMVRNWTKRFAAVIAASFREQAKNLASCEGRLKDWNVEYYANPEAVKKEILTRFTPDAEAVGITLSEELFNDADEALAELLPQIAEASKAWKFSRKAKPARDAFVKAGYEKAWGAKVLKMWYNDDGWRVYVNEHDVPQYRTRRFTVLFQVKGESWCHADDHYYVQDAKGRGFGKSYFEQAPTAGTSTFVSCK